MAYRGILVVRDEVDIIAQTLAHILAWCDRLYVYDTGSTDGTWELVQDAASRDKRVLPVAREPVYFTDGVRAMVFERVRHEFRHRDWVARLDADEIHLMAPPLFVRERLRPSEGRVYCQIYEFALTRAEVDAWDRGEETLADRSRPIQERRRRYFVDPFPELRLFRYRRLMQWPPDRYEPLSAGLLARERLPIMHFRCRDPEQVKRRCEIRAAMAAHGVPAEHWRVEDWRKWVLPDDDPRLRRLAPGEALPEVHEPLPRAVGLRGLLQRAYYGARIVNGVDLLRPRFPRGYKPEPMAAASTAGASNR